MRVLLVEDDPTISKSIELMLTHANLNVYCTDLGEEGVDLAKLYDYDLILLDLNLPDMHGHDVLRQLRVAKVETPILILTGEDDTESKIKGFGFGADDYLTKPFSIQELLARIRAALRKRRNVAGSAESMLQVKNLTLYPARHEAQVDGNAIELTKKEYDLLEYLVRNKQMVLDREHILRSVWGYDYIGDTNVVDVYIRYLRSKIDERFQEKYIYTIRGIGYAVKE